MKWYFGYEQQTEARQEDLVRMAVRSAKKHTSLEPICIVSGTEMTELVVWMKRQGVRCIFHFSTLMTEIEETKKKDSNFSNLTARGAYLRLDIPIIDASDEEVLYTDTDVMFLTDPAPTHTLKAFSAAPEMDIEDWKLFNTGVMFINLVEFRKMLPELFAFIRPNLRSFVAYDQGALHRFVPSDKFDRLAPEWNWKPYWGMNQEAKIVHWHGPKPAEVQKFLFGDFSECRAPRIISLFRKAPDAYNHYLDRALSLA